jgi:hypothetical protein
MQAALSGKIREDKAISFWHLAEIGPDQLQTLQSLFAV